MLVLIDESGCPGFKLTKGSTSYFIMAMIIFKDYLQAEAVSQEITKLRQNLKINPEFKFSKTRAKIKNIFFEKIGRFDFEISALIVKKAVFVN